MYHFYFTEEDLEWLKQNRSEVTYSKGETIIKQGTFATHVLFLKAGLAKIIIEAENKKRLAVEVVPPGSFIGLPFLHTEYFRFTVESMKKATMHQIRRRAFRKVLENNVEARQNLLYHYSDYYTGLLYKLEINSTRNNHGKLAHILYALSDETYTKEDIFCHLTRKDLAELASISKESTNKILKELKHDCIIDVTQEGIDVVQPELLKRLSMIG